jgi:hypothetical protein
MYPSSCKTVKKVNLGSVPHHPNEVHRIPLPDGVPRPPILGMYVAKRGQGKSTAAVRLLKYYVDHDPPVFHTNLVFVVSPTAASQKHLWDHVGIPDCNVYTATTAADVQQVVNHIVDILRVEKEHYDDDQEYLEAYRKLTHDLPLTLREEMVLESRNAMPLKDPHPWPRPMLMLDDLSHMKILDKPWFISLCLRHRHLAGGVSLSMLIICQSLHGGLSRVVRQNCSLICLFSTHDKTCIDDLYKECSHLLDQEEFIAVFENATDDFHSFLAVDLSQTDANLVFSKEFEHWYQIRNRPSGDFPAPESKEEAKEVVEVGVRKPRSKKKKLEPEPKIKKGALI